MARSRYTKEFVQKKLNMWLEAEDALATSKSYSFEGRTLTRADRKDIESRIAFWTNELDKIESGRTSANRIYQVIPH